MPIYEYRCTSCHTELEKLQKISDPPLVECPECGKAALVKLISASSCRLKGSGWYETDFKTGKKKNGAAEESAGTPAAESGSAATDAGDKAVTDNAGKSATESTGKKEPSIPAKGETKTSAEAKPSAGNNASQAKSS